MAFIEMSPQEFVKWLDKQNVRRKITVIQLHHTASPSYSNWNKRPDGLYWQNSMKNSHISRGFSEIAQQFTICPDGTVVTGRSLNTAPAGIKGANSNGICIEVLGNFDTGRDTMTSEQQRAVATVVKALLDKFHLSPEKGVTYHAWWTAGGKSLGTYIPGRSAKTCPGTAFFGGNTRQAYETGLMPLLKGSEQINEDSDLKTKEELTMAQYEELKAKIEALQKEVAELKSETAIYNYIDDNMPQWAHVSVKWCADKGIIHGTGEGLGLNKMKLWVCVVVYRTVQIVAKMMGMKI